MNMQPHLVLSEACFAKITEGKGFRTSPLDFSLISGYSFNANLFSRIP